MTQTLSRRRALQLMGVAAVLPFSRAWAADGDALTFLAVGDWGRDGADRQSEVAQQMGLTAKAVKARFVVSVGDNFYEKGVESATDPKWKTSFEDVYAAPSLQIPWYVALGNHDYYGTPEAQLEYAKTSSRWRMPQRYYSRRETAPDGSSLELFVLDTVPIIPDYLAHKGLAPKLAGLDPDGQVAWLDGALAGSTADWKVVIGHHPIWCGDNSHAGKEGHGGSPDLVAKLDPLLKRYGVHLYLNGHEHELQHTVHDGRHYVCTGAGSAMEPICDTAGADFCSLDSGFIACAVTKSALRVAYKDWQGRELRVVDIPA